MSKEIIHSSILIVTIALGFLIPKTVLARFDLQITAILFIALFLIKKFIQTSRLLESVVFTLIVLILVNTTGGAASPFFFLLYFLLFSLALLLEPVVSIVMTFSCVVFFLLFLPDTNSFQSILSVFSLAFLTPFALFMGREYLEAEKSKAIRQKNQQDTFLFLSLVMKNQLKSIKHAVENFMGDGELDQVKRSVDKMERSIEDFEKEG